MAWSMSSASGPRDSHDDAIGPHAERFDHEVALGHAPCPSMLASRVSTPHDVPLLEHHSRCLDRDDSPVSG